MKRLLLLTPSELTQDPRARRAATAALGRGLHVLGLSGRVSGETPAALDGVPIRRIGRARAGRALPETGAGQPRRGALHREAIGLYRLLRLAARTVAFWRAGRQLGRVDVVHANDFDTLPAAFLLARRARARLVYDAHEIYSEFESHPPRLYHAAATALEGTLARRSDAVVTVNEGIADDLRDRFGLQRRPRVVLNCPGRNGTDPALGRTSGNVRATYLGWLGGPGRLLDDLLEAMPHAPNTELTLRLVRTDLEALRARVDSLGLGDRIHVAEPVPPGRLLEALEGFEVGVVIDRPVSRNSELVLPNKLFEYLMAGLAVVAPRLPALARLIEDEGVGVTFEPGRPESLAAALEQLASDRPALGEMRRRARRAAVERYNAEEQVHELTAAWGL